MNRPEYYDQDVLRFFDGKPRQQALYETLFTRLEENFPDASVKVQKSQISFYGRHLFAAASLPVRRRKEWPRDCILVTFGLGTRVVHDRIAVAVEPYPNRWTHHVVVTGEDEVDDRLMDWLRAAWDFGENKS